jgi:hypothetical protein
MVQGNRRVRVQPIKEAVDSLCLGEEGGRRRRRKGGRSSAGACCSLGLLVFGHSDGDIGALRGRFAAVVCGPVAEG